MVCCTLLIAADQLRADEQKDHVCFRAIDANQDGSVTYPEFERFYADSADRFKAIDLDKDGLLSHEEYHESLLGGGAS
jgi:Ca2+-binding EF-hand superfamily protein